MSAQLQFHLLFISLFIYVTARYQPVQLEVKQQNQAEHSQRKMSIHKQLLNFSNTLLIHSEKIMLSLYKAYQKEQKKKRRAEEKRIDEIVKTLSPAAQKADKIIRGIYNNVTLTRKEMDHAIEVQLSKLDKETYNELVFATQ
ncbi:hypothetical protein WR25_10039 [Diploscapter pachys]|uniref:Uncharacterized protein n=1 Tax=Diploscapter pachys TaxID=2018661 RepID=A0A2A2JAW0_9BILA|nr:hypothetical protein WR25_10039 [Diploscapter pachys]